MSKSNKVAAELTKPNFPKLHLKFDNSCKHAKDQPKNAPAMNTVNRLKAKLIGYKHNDFVENTLAKYEMA